MNIKSFADVLFAVRLKYKLLKVFGGAKMKRMLAKLLSFLLITIMTVAVVCSLSANFPTVYRIVGVKGECADDGGWVLYTNRGADGAEKALTRIPKAGKIIEAIAKPQGFILCTALYLVLLFIGRKKKTPQRSDLSAAYDRFYCESEEDISEDEASVSDTSLTLSSYE